MSDLLTSLSTAARALDAQRFGLDVTGQNIANANTPGYTRRSADLTEVPPLDHTSAGGGVTVRGVQAARATLIEARLAQERPMAGRESVVAEQLAVVESALGAPGEGLDASLSAFFDAFAALAEDPTSTVARELVNSQAQTLVGGVRDLAARLEAYQRNADTELRSVVDQVNELAETIRSLNVAIASAPTGGSDTQRDQQAAAVQSLAALVDIGVIPREDGGVDVSIGNGRALVAGERAYPLTTSSQPPLGLADLSVGSADVTAEISGGRLGGLLQVRDVLLPGYHGRLDFVAFNLTNGVNAIHQAGYDLTGNPGGDFFVPTVFSGAASMMALDPGVATDPTRIAAAKAPAAGDNQNALAIAALRDGPSSPLQSWGALVQRIGIDRRTAISLQDNREDVVRQLETLRDQISGVSLDEEAAWLMRFQRAYEANARFFSVVDGLLDTFMTTVGR